MQLLVFLAQRQIRKLGSVHTENTHGRVFPDEFIGVFFAGLDLLVGQISVKVDGHDVFRHVKANVFHAEQHVIGMRKQVFARVLLGVFQTLCGIHLERDDFAHSKRLFCSVQHRAVRFKAVRDRHKALHRVVNRADVAQLPAALREKRCAVGLQVITAVFTWCTAYNARGAFERFRRGEIYFFAAHLCTPFVKRGAAAAAPRPFLFDITV